MCFHVLDVSTNICSSTRWSYIASLFLPTPRPSFFTLSLYRYVCVMEVYPAEDSVYFLCFDLAKETHHNVNETNTCEVIYL